MSESETTEWQWKIWGKTRKIVSSRFYSKHELSITPSFNDGVYCSLHYHRRRYNNFIILSGSILIIEMYGPLAVKKILNAGDQYSVPLLVPHMFVAQDKAHVFEEYYGDNGLEIQDDDIHRITSGGKMCISAIDKLPYIILNN